ncbi:MAG: electron transport complex subunit RsxC [Clostridia bacterium]|nr:electron transport complex subunit RsxC [Clostridia bacterium]
MKAVNGKFFFGGVHPKDAKALTSGCPIEVMPSPTVVKVSTLQSLGKPAVPVVEVGATVKEGTLIAKADGAISSDVFASVCGQVTEIKDELGAGGAMEKFIVITPDGKDEKDYLKPLTDPSAEEIKERVKDCGIVGLGGAGFPTAVKLAPKTAVDTLVINGAECEPYLTRDHRLMLEKTDEVVRGARYLAKALGGVSIVIGIESNKPDAIAAFEKYEDVKVVRLRKKYPMGGEKQLIYATLGRKVGLGKLPADSGVIVNNVGTCFAVCEAVELGKPLYEGVVTVSGKAVKHPKNLLVKVGTPVSEIIDYCGGEAVTPKKVINGGPMTGTALANYDNYTHKTTSGVLLLDEKEAAAEEPTPCLNCGMCADVCPMHLMPMNTAFYSAAGDFETAQKLGNALSCIECGACEYICPAKRPLIQAIRKTKAALRNNK